ncbi:hypothetical protein LCGC14_1246970 [marine sediment metagenome]|uniref:Uncharacterized protein n=1 Tax=marine sediment metagenome TaxID=412755 RepID=A0A0F9P848_9ZZZZ
MHLIISAKRCDIHTNNIVDKQNPRYRHRGLNLFKFFERCKTNLMKDYLAK